MLKSGQTYRDDHKQYYLVCAPSVEGIDGYYLINLNTSEVTRFKKAEVEKLVSDMTPVKLELTDVDRVDIDSRDNPFTWYTDKLAKILKHKNTAYGDSFAESVNDFGSIIYAIRIGDKYHRLVHLIKNNEAGANGESLDDTLTDLAGYAILSVKYRLEHENGDKHESDND